MFEGTAEPGHRRSVEVFPSSARHELYGGGNPAAALAPLSFSFGSRSDKGLRLAEHSGSASRVVGSASEQPRLCPTGRQCEANLKVRSKYYPGYRTSGVNNHGMQQPVPSLGVSL